ncbi:hypothetical protein BC936DRAFT_148152 [Jimgerdemannia flammicorona]|uniref:Uncharacterized protein n=1 Tax=Jimgerdemannia flammicorona TaxID=994334 RepID=A0A433DKN6_9FUNG|nr:hypothetical protein BC936DRAFT_148152 [Jimgerdemannia flammicorona]
MWREESERWRFGRKVIWNCIKITGDVAFTKTLRIVERDKARNKEVRKKGRKSRELLGATTLRRKSVLCFFAVVTDVKPARKRGDGEAQKGSNIHSQCIHATGRTTNFM